MKDPAITVSQRRLVTTMHKITLVPVLSLFIVPLAAQSAKHQASDPRVPGKRPNILIVLSDDQGYGDLSCHGNPILKTPNLDRLYSQSIRLTEFHVSGISTPSRSQLLTGVDNLRNRACQWGYGLEFIRHDIPTMAEIFGSAGYCAGQFGKWHLGDMYPHRPSDRGFKESVRFGGASIQQTPDHWDSDGFDDFYWHNDVWKQYKGYCTDIFFDEAIRFMKECHKKDQPFLTYLPTPAVHDPCFVDEKYRQPYRDAKFNGQPLPPNVISYYGMVSNLDMNIGRLEKFLSEEGLRENTIVIFMSDNGGVQGVPIYDAGMSGTKGSLLEGGHRQSCFISWPAGGLRPAGDVGGLTEIQDLLPTLLDLSGTEKSNATKFDGISLAPLLRGNVQDLSERMLTVQWSWGGKEQGTVLWKRWRLTGSKDGWQLHNLESDPYQKTDLKSEHQDIVAKMHEYYEAWWSGLEPALKLYECPHIGDPRANPLTLTCFDYISQKPLKEGSFNVCIQSCVRKGVGVHGKWRLQAVTAGRYQITLLRWPSEANAAITAGLPMQKLTDPYPEDLPDRRFWYDTPQAGVALPVTLAKVRFGEQEQTANVSREDKYVKFIFTLQAACEIELETWFFNLEGQELCSAPYVEITKI
jgi:arylsulfatase A-like enzyme